MRVYARSASPPVGTGGERAEGRATEGARKSVIPAKAGIQPPPPEGDLCITPPVVPANLFVIPAKAGIHPLRFLVSLSNHRPFSGVEGYAKVSKEEALTVLP